MRPARHASGKGVAAMRQTIFCAAVDRRSATIVVSRGADVPPGAPVSVILLCLHADPLVADALRSVLDQDVPAEVIVVNTGAGTLRGLLEEDLSRIVLVECDEARPVGAARNLGIRHATAPIIAFLACDCRATPGWLRRRIELHRMGHEMVASALRPAGSGGQPAPAAAWAAHAVTHIGRTPETPARMASRYGLSYARALFERFGPFDGTLQVGEDSEFNARVRSRSAIAWDPSIVTLHVYPDTLRSAIADQFERGRRAAAHRRQVAGEPALVQPLRIVTHGLLVSYRVAAGYTAPRIRTPAVALMMVLLLMARLAGALSLSVMSEPAASHSSS